MHSHDKTLLASLGFADSDKKDNRHDLACQYLIDEDRAMALSTLFRDETCKDGVDWSMIGAQTEFHLSKGEGKYQSTIGFLDAVIHFEYYQHYETDLMHSTYSKEAAIMAFQADLTSALRDTGVYFSGEINVRYKPECQNFSSYVRTSSYAADDKVEQVMAVIEPLIERHRSEIGSFAQTKKSRAALDIVVEVKIHPLSVGALLRQIELYRSYYQGRGKTVWVVATAFDMDAADVGLLKNQNITHVRLGAKFDEYVKTREQAPQKSLSFEV